MAYDDDHWIDQHLEMAYEDRFAITDFDGFAEINFDVDNAYSGTYEFPTEAENAAAEYLGDLICQGVSFERALTQAIIAYNLGEEQAQNLRDYFDEETY